MKEYLEFRKTLGYSNRQEYCLVQFDAYCHEHYPDLEILTKESVRGWVSYESARRCGSMEKQVTSVRMLAQYIGGGAYVLPANIFPSRPKYMPYILTDSELCRLFHAADSIKEGKHYRKGSSLKLILPTLLRLLYTCGLRPNEGRLIKRNNINFSTGEILIEKSKGHKGHRERIVVVSDDMLKQCRKYDIIRAIGSPKSDCFFVRADGICVNTQQLNYAFNLCWQQANHDVPVNMLPRVRPYDLRHRFASTILQKWLSEGRDLYAMLPYLQAYMGHEKFSSTVYYIHLLPEHLLNSPGVDWSAIDSVNPEVDIWKA
jgi:integrase